MILKIFTDGGSKGNPGPSAIGIVFYLDNKQIYTYREDIGISTNNIAEYTAVLRALEYIKSHVSSFKLQASNIKFISDSMLLVNQLNGVYKIKNGTIAELIFKIKALEIEIGMPISYTHVRREENTVADALVNDKLK